jgi:hypothetical protein
VVEAVDAGAVESRPAPIVEVEEDGEEGVDEVFCEVAGDWPGWTSFGAEAHDANNIVIRNAQLLRMQPELRKFIITPWLESIGKGPGLFRRRR